MRDDEKTRQFIATQTHMVVAVVHDGDPWAVPLAIKRWDGTQFEWDSRIDTVHSRAISSNPKIAITIFEKEHDAEFGFYAAATAELVEETSEGYGRYRATVSRSWINDESFVKREVSLG